MTTWVQIDRAEIMKAIESVDPRTQIKSQPGPYAIPTAVRSIKDPELVVLDFNYSDAITEPREKHGEGAVAIETGKNTGRVYVITIKAFEKWFREAVRVLDADKTKWTYVAIKHVLDRYANKLESET